MATSNDLVKQLRNQSFQLWGMNGDPLKVSTSSSEYCRRLVYLIGDVPKINKFHQVRII